MRLFAHHTAEHTITSESFYLVAALMVVAVLAIWVARREK